jgi:acetyl-CoA acyltransferase
MAGLPKETGGKVVNRLCGSSMDAAHQMSQAILAGDIECGIAGGAEDMFGVPMGGYLPSFNPLLYEQEYYIGMGETAENLAKELSISREDQESFSVNSHNKALKAIEGGKFDNEIAAITFNENTITVDEGPRTPNVDKMKSLNPAFDAEGTITAATSSPISVGASAVLLAGDKFIANNNLKAKFRIKSRAIAGVDWKTMGSGPLPATEKALDRAGMCMSDLDAIELNEAFAAQSLYVIRKGGWDESKININGGAIALGHPLGCSGTRIIITLMNVLEQNDLNTGLATMCIGTGQGIATIIERV